MRAVFGTGALLVAVASPAWALPMFVQNTTSDTWGSDGTASATLSGATTQGNLLILAVTFSEPLSQVVSVTDSGGNTFQRALGPVIWGIPTERWVTELWVAANINATSAPTLTANLSRREWTSFIALYWSEYAGVEPVEPLDQVAHVAGASAAPPRYEVTSGPAVATWNEELVFGHAEAIQAVVSGGSGFAVRTVNNWNVEQDRVITGGGPVEATFLLTADTAYFAAMLTFRGAGSADGGTGGGAGGGTGGGGSAGGGSAGGGSAGGGSAGGGSAGGGSAGGGSARGGLAGGGSAGGGSAGGGSAGGGSAGGGSAGGGSAGGGSAGGGSAGGEGAAVGSIGFGGTGGGREPTTLLLACGCGQSGSVASALMVGALLIAGRRCRGRTRPGGTPSASRAGRG